MADNNTPRHRLKTWPEYYQALIDGRKTFELRFDDRGYDVGHVLVLDEFDVTKGYTGRTSEWSVTYLLRGVAFGLAEGHVCMGVQPA